VILSWWHREPALQAELEVQLKMKKSEVVRAQQELSSVTKEKDRLLKRVKKLENVLPVTSAVVPSLTAQKEQLQLNLKREEEESRKVQDVCTAASSCLSTLCCSLSARLTAQHGWHRSRQRYTATSTCAVPAPLMHTLPDANHNLPDVEH
jgi:outer membrane PBP1 activator LpoA protein